MSLDLAAQNQSFLGWASQEAIYMLMPCLLSDWGSTQIQASINGLAFPVSWWFIWYFGWLSLFIY